MDTQPLHEILDSSSLLGKAERLKYQIRKEYEAKQFDNLETGFLIKASTDLDVKFLVLVQPFNKGQNIQLEVFLNYFDLIEGSKQEQKQLEKEIYDSIGSIEDNFFVESLIVLSLFEIKAKETDLIFYIVPLINICEKAGLWTKVTYRQSLDDFTYPNFICLASGSSLVSHGLYAKYTDAEPGYYFKAFSRSTKTTRKNQNMPGRRLFDILRIPLLNKEIDLNKFKIDAIDACQYFVETSLKTINEPKSKPHNVNKFDKELQQFISDNLVVLNQEKIIQLEYDYLPDLSASADERKYNLEKYIQVYINFDSLYERFIDSGYKYSPNKYFLQKENIEALIEELVNESISIDLLNISDPWGIKEFPENFPKPLIKSP